MTRSKKLAALLLVISGLSHVAQLPVYGARPNIIGAALFGVAYLVIGLLLWRDRRVSLWLGATLPLIGSFGGLYRMLALDPNPVTAIHIAINVVVASICIFWLARETRRRDAATRVPF